VEPQKDFFKKVNYKDCKFSNYEADVKTGVLPIACKFTAWLTVSCTTTSSRLILQNFTFFVL